MLLASLFQIQAQTTQPLALKRAGARHDGASVLHSATLSNGTTVIGGMKSMVDKSWSYGFLTYTKPDGSLLKEILVGEGARGASQIRRIIVEPGTDNVYALGGTNLWEGDFASQDPPDEDAMLIKLDAQGNMIWWHVFGGKNSDLHHQLCLLPNGNIATFGTEGINIMKKETVMRVFNSDGEMLKRTVLPLHSDQRIKQVRAAQNGGYWLGIDQMVRQGNKVTNINTSLVRLNPGGQIVSQSKLQGSRPEQINDLLETEDGHVLLSVKASSSDGDFDGVGNYLFNFDQNGEMQWKQYFLNPTKDINSMKITTRPSGEIYCAVNVNKTAPEFPLKVVGLVNIWIAKLDANGGLISKKRVDALGHFCECIDIDWHNGELRMGIEGQAKHSMQTYIPHDAWFCSIDSF